jgi:hypothetical protein
MRTTRTQRIAKDAKGHPSKRKDKGAPTTFLRLLCVFCETFATFAFRMSVPDSGFGM